jgi:hypothetical protein
VADLLLLAVPRLFLLCDTDSPLAIVGIEASVEVDEEAMGDLPEYCDIVSRRIPFVIVGL